MKVCFARRQQRRGQQRNLRPRKKSERGPQAMRARNWLSLLALASLSWACEQKAAQQEPSAATTASTSSPAKASSANAANASASASAASANQKGAASSPQTGKAPRPLQENHYPEAQRLVAIGDLHGDFAATKAALVLAGAIATPDDDAPWSGGKLVLVQTGDQLDRGDGELPILEMLKRLKQEALAAGGRVVVLNGNHETMNAMGDFRYVTPGGFSAFSNLTGNNPLVARFSAEQKGRAAAFLPGGTWAKELATQPLVAQVGETLFAHGGVLPAHVRAGLDVMNRETQAWLLGKRGMPPPAVIAENGPLWTRLYGADVPSELACAAVEQVLAFTSAKRMVVGHTVQAGGVNFACERKLVRIDIGLSAHYGAKELTLLAIEEGQAKILRAPLPR